MRRLFRLRLPLALTLAVVVQGAAVAAGAEYLGSPLLPRPGWASPAVVTFLFAYVILSVAVGLLVCSVRLGGLFAGRETGRDPSPRLSPRLSPAPRAAPAHVQLVTRTGPTPNGPAARFRRWRLEGSTWPGPARATKPVAQRFAVAAGLAAVVLLVGGAHLGERSGFWATSQPRRESDPSTADGHVIWLEGQPLQEDSGTFISGVEVMTGRLKADAITGYARSGRTAYPFLVSLLVPLTGLAGSVYAAFVAVNFLFWWGGALALYGLARKATGSEWAGIAAGAMVATGIGFAFATGATMSTVAAYGAVPVVLWCMDRLGVLTARSRRTDDFLAGCLAAGAGLLNSLAPFFLCFAFCDYLGRSELRRLLLWAGTVLVLGQAWSLWLGWAGRPVEGWPLGSVRVALALVAGLVLLSGLTRLPRRLGEGLIGAAVLGATAVAVLVFVFFPGQIKGVADTVVVGLHLPEYVADRVLPLLLRGGGGASSLADLQEGLRLGAFDLNVASAFPGPVLWLAAVGLPRLPQRWRDWAFAVIVSAGVTTFVMDTLTTEPHTRLMFLAYPGVYLLAANGLLNLYRLVAGAARRLPVLTPRAASGVAVAAVVVLVLLAAVPAQASLWGDWSYDLMFHFRGI